MFIDLLACLFVCLFVRLFGCLFVLFVCLFACLFVCLFVCLFACLFVCLFVCLVEGKDFARTEEIRSFRRKERFFLLLGFLPGPAHAVVKSKSGS